MCSWSAPLSAVPVDLLDTDTGERLVFRALGAIEHGLPP